MTRRLITAVTLTLTLAATTAAKRAPSDPCALLTVAQVSAALGVTVDAGKPLGSKGCYWREVGGTKSKKVAVTLLTPQAFAMGKQPLPGTDKPAVSGVGDEAYYKYFLPPRYDQIKAVDLDVKKGDALVGVEVGGLPVDDAKAKARVLILEVLKKL